MMQAHSPTPSGFVSGSNRQGDRAREGPRSRAHHQRVTGQGRFLSGRHLHTGEVLRRLALVALLAAVSVPAASALQFLGVLGSKSRFQALTGQRSTVGHVILGWNQGYRWGTPLSALVPQHGMEPGKYEP
jgi:hypothetical protein